MRKLVLDIQNLTTRFESAEGIANALDSLSLEIYEGEVVGLVGESGSGKSMTGYSIMGLVEHPGSIVGGLNSLPRTRFTLARPRANPESTGRSDCNDFSGSDDVSEPSPEG